MKIDELKRIIELSWSMETCVPSLKNNWTIENKSLGQCAVTALIINLYMGGKIMRCMCETGSHYYNLIFLHMALHLILNSYIHIFHF